MSIQLNFSTPLYNQVFDNPDTITPVGKNSLKECVYVNLALKIQCHILLQTAFSAILPTETRLAPDVKMTLLRHQNKVVTTWL